jgi:HAE1 family hydrophobic/amphiphilic exporter-1
MLFGIVKKNGILQIDYTNVLRSSGMELNAAILEANKTRLRPILMTTLMLIAAMVPIALGQGPGAGARASMAKVIIGGQGLSLLLTLLVTPVAYSLWEDFTKYSSRFWSWIGRRWLTRATHETVSPSHDGTALVGAEAASSATTSDSGH